MSYIAILLVVIIVVAGIYIAYVSAKCDEMREELFNDRIETWRNKRDD